MTRRHSIKTSWLLVGVLLVVVGADGYAKATQLPVNRGLAAYAPISQRSSRASQGDR
jgi:uncharacterized membrane protein